MVALGEAISRGRSGMEAEKRMVRRSGSGEGVGSSIVEERFVNKAQRAQHIAMGDLRQMTTVGDLDVMRSLEVRWG